MHRRLAERAGGLSEKTVFSNQYAMIAGLFYRGSALKA